MHQNNVSQMANVLIHFDWLTFKAHRFYHSLWSFDSHVEIQCFSNDAFVYKQNQTNQNKIRHLNCISNVFFVVVKFFI